MKVAHLISNYLPNIGGAQVCVHQIANNTIKRGHKAVVITPTRDASDSKYNFLYEIIRLNNLLNKFLFINFSLGKLYLEKVLNDIQKRYNFDIWQVTVGYPLGAASVDFFNRNMIPCILRCSGEDIQVLHDVGYGYRLDKKVDTIIKDKYKKFSAFVTASENTKKDYLLLGIPNDKLFIIPNGVDFAKFQMYVNKKRVRNELGIQEGERLIITVGRNHPKKGFKYIPEIMKQLLRKGSRVKWLLVGKDGWRIKELAEREGVGEYLINLELKSHILENGECEVPDIKLIEYYKASDIFVFPTLIEAFGKVIIEAMAAGLPIVTTSAPGANDIIRQNENGIKCVPNDIECFVEAILKLLSDNELSNRLRNNALQDSKRYDWKIVTDMYLKLYEKLLKGV